ncbi:MAG: hypothetical protein RBU21_11305 [FCB group bacterium]|nr:hypothetical protein [FCB group bacterium]
MRGFSFTSPAWALLKRELTATLRGKAVFWMLAVVVGICCLLVAANWPRQGQSYAYIGGQARTMFCLFFFAQLLAATLLPPGLAALAFSEERRQDTLDQLRLSLITTGGLVGAKFLAAVAVLVLLMVASLPCLGAQLMLVGVSARQVLDMTALTLSTALLGAAMGILCAVAFRRPAKAMAMSYLGVVFVLGGWILAGILLLLVISFLFFGGNMDRCIDTLLGRSLFQRTFEDTARALFGGYLYTLSAGAAPLGMGSTGAGVAYRMVAASGCLLWAILLSRRLTAPAALPSRKLIDEPEALRARKRRFPFYLIDPLQRLPLIADHDNPVFVREWRYSLSRRPRATVWAFVLTAAVVTGVHLLVALEEWGRPWQYEDAQRVVLVLEVVVMALIAHIVSTGAFVRERENMSMDLLRASLLSPSDIFWGQFGGGAAAVLPYLAGTSLGFLVSLAAVPFGLGTAPMLLGGYATLVTVVWLTLCISCLATGYARSTASAMAGGLMANLCVYAGPVLMLVWAESTLQLPGRYHVENFIERLSPILALCAYRWRSYWTPSDVRVHDLSVEGDLYLVLAASAAFGFLFLMKGKERFERQHKQM